MSVTYSPDIKFAVIAATTHTHNAGSVKDLTYALVGLAN